MLFQNQQADFTLASLVSELATGAFAPIEKKGKGNTHPAIEQKKSKKRDLRRVGQRRFGCRFCVPTGCAFRSISL